MQPVSFILYVGNVLLRVGEGDGRRGGGEGRGGEGVINSQAALLWVTAIRLSLQYT